LKREPTRAKSNKTRMKTQNHSSVACAAAAWSAAVLSSPVLVQPYVNVPLYSLFTLISLRPQFLACCSAIFCKSKVEVEEEMVQGGKKKKATKKQKVITVEV
jgi:hypothetical protein